MYGENDILTELFNVLGLSKEDIKTLKDECKDYVKDAYKRAGEQKKSEKKNDITTSEPRSGYMHVANPTETEEPEIKENVACDSTEPQAQQIASDVVSIGNTYFELNKHAGNAILGGDSIKIEFEDKFDNFTFPGITNKQLLWVLYVRYMHDPKKFALVKQLLATEL